ncbi:MAG: DUF1302 domain-containing protein [Oceanococcus sp.]|nr:MAG: DUF1302 domain-containing protein [Oceanococcus sp.]
MPALQCRTLARASLMSLGVVALPAQAASYLLGPVDVQVDTTLSAGVSLRMSDPDADQIAISNGGTSRSANGDDGNLGYKAGDVVSSAIKATFDIDASISRQYGLFSRISAFYNPEADNAGDLEARLSANDGAGRSRALGEAELGRRGHSRLDSEVELLDLFAYGSFRLGERSILVQAGNQVVNWGESTFIGNSINVLNPIDVVKFRLPGSELKEALTPTPMLWIGGSLTDNLSAELVWMADWKEVEIDPRGSYFSTNDFASDDGDNVVVSFGRRHDDNTRPFAVLNDDPSDDGAQQAWVPREHNRDPKDQTSQAGFALRYYAEWLNSTEFGLYYLNYHSRLPLVSSIRGAATNPGNLGTPTCSQDPAADGCRASYFVEYPEDIQLYGLSFNTSGPAGVAIQGEVSYRPNNPVQISGAEVVLASLVPAGSLLRPAGAAPGETIRGYERVATTQAQVTLTKAMGPSFGASQWILLSEIGYTHQDLSDLPFNGPGAALPSCRQPGGAALLAAVSNGSCQEAVGGGFATTSSWGYRFVTRLDYTNVFASINMSPRLVWFHNVNGVSSNFNEDSNVLALGLRFDYLQRWQADIAYTAFLGGRNYSGTDPVAPGAQLNETTFAPGSPDQSSSFSTSSNPSADRDFLAISISYAF